MNRPYSSSCDQNKDAIYEVINPYLPAGVEVLEIGSGTGQHAIHFAELKPDIRWQTSDKLEYLSGIRSWIDFANLPNLLQVQELNVNKEWPARKYDRVFTANSLHIMSETEADLCIRGAAGCLKPGGFLMVYGPFNYNGEFTSQSNRQFEFWLKNNDSNSGIKDFETINEIATQSGLELKDDVTMPANNRILIWQFA